MAKQMQASANREGNDARDDATPFRRLLVVTDQSEAAQGAFQIVNEWVGDHTVDVQLVEVTEERRRRRSGVEADVDPMRVGPTSHLVVNGPTRGARNRQLVHGIAAAADAFGADVIVLGFDRTRLSGHRLAASLREQIMRTTDLPVLVAPSPASNGKGHHRTVAAIDRDEERAQNARRYARV